MATEIVTGMLVGIPTSFFNFCFAEDGRLLVFWSFVEALPLLLLPTDKLNLPGFFHCLLGGLYTTE